MIYLGVFVAYVIICGLRILSGAVAFGGVGLRNVGLSCEGEVLAVGYAGYRALHICAVKLGALVSQAGERFLMGVPVGIILAAGYHSAFRHDLPEKNVRG